MDKIYVILTAVFLIGLLSLSLVRAYATDTYTECQLQEKERVVKGDSSKYLIFCNEEVFENSDSMWYWKFGSSDFYGELEAGNSYTFRVYGWRVPFLSWYRNIIEIEPLT